MEPLRISAVDFLKPETQHTDFVRVIVDAFRQLEGWANKVRVTLNTLEGLASAAAKPTTSGQTTKPNSIGGYNRFATSATTEEMLPQWWIIQGSSSGGLGRGMLCYPSGQTWMPASTGTAGAWARGVATDIANSATITLFGMVDMRVADTSVEWGDTLYASSSPGVATIVRPDPASDLFVQEVGFVCGAVVNGLVRAFLIPRIEPEQ